MNCEIEEFTWAGDPPTECSEPATRMLEASNWVPPRWRCEQWVRDGWAQWHVCERHYLDLLKGYMTNDHLRQNLRFPEEGLTA